MLEDTLSSASDHELIIPSLIIPPETIPQSTSPTTSIITGNLGLRQSWLNLEDPILAYEALWLVSSISRWPILSRPFPHYMPSSRLLCNELGGLVQRHMPKPEEKEKPQKRTMMGKVKGEMRATNVRRRNVGAHANESIPRAGPVLMCMIPAYIFVTRGMNYTEYGLQVFVR